MKKILPYVLTGLLTLGGLSSCQDFFELESEQVLFVDDLKLNTVNDTVYSVIGIINRLQQVADKTVLLGEIRSDLISLTDKADLELQALATFTAGTNNLYNRPQDYYAIINNCNYFIANADTALRK
ncbi:MAG: RagB/SusD family nutrient uptake outer membrane protein, partial [Bacteroidales bacterium]|nr:RagB/SusD family nutrient uptake outer membrane protein [Bacteroidales bacterium]